MPSVFGIPLIGFIQMVLGTLIIIFILVKYLIRPKKGKKGEYIINDVHIIVGDGSEAYHQYVYIKGGIIKQISLLDYYIVNNFVVRLYMILFEDFLN